MRYHGSTPVNNSVFLPCVELNARQIEMLDLLCADLAYREIAERQQRTVSAVYQDICKLMHELGYRSQVGLAVWWTLSRSALYVRPVARTAAGSSL